MAAWMCIALLLAVLSGLAQARKHPPAVRIIPAISLSNSALPRTDPMILLVTALLLSQDPTPRQPDREPTQQWPAWRGPLGTGEAPESDPPIDWSEDNNLLWKTALPGLGHSTPVIWGNRLFLTWATPFGEQVAPAPETDPGAHNNPPVVQAHRFEVAAFERLTGALLWQVAVHTELPHERSHETGSFASASPVTDGERLFAFFGSRGLYCLDLDGVVYWSKQLGQMRTKHHHGEGSSPVLYRDALVVNWDHEEESFVLCLDKSTGEERWRVSRDEATSWATPIVVEVDGKAQVVISGTKRIRGYDLASGMEVWNSPGMAHNVVATPVYGDGILVAASSYEKQAMIGLRLAGAKGALAETDKLLWYRRRRTPYVPSPLLADGWIHTLNHNQGLFFSVDIQTGTSDSALRLDHLGDIFASPIAAGGRIYICDRSGMTAVLSQSQPHKVLAWNQLADAFSASPIAVGQHLYLRGERFLYCLQHLTQKK